jgi:hypothetical protein|tara:strand:+ start:530 stop:661 length:132 start_codon:yes stop_codon:yes gene_type:complete
MNKSRQILTEEMDEEQVRKAIRKELARVFFDLYRKRSVWENTK